MPNIIRVGGGKVESRTYLYNEGDECTALTGGWGIKFNRQSAQGTLTKNAGDMLLQSTKVNGTNNTTGAGTNNNINLSKYSKLYFLSDITQVVLTDKGSSLESSLGVVSSFAASGSGANNTFTNTVVKSSKIRTTVGTSTYVLELIEIDISGINGGYIAFDAWYLDLQTNNTGYATTKLIKAWIE